jgi:hypothetical protein
VRKDTTNEVVVMAPLDDDVEVSVPAPPQPLTISAPKVIKLTVRVMCFITHRTVASRVHQTTDTPSKVTNYGFLRGLHL